MTHDNYGRAVWSITKDMAGLGILVMVLPFAFFSCMISDWMIARKQKGKK